MEKYHNDKIIRLKQSIHLHSTGMDNSCVGRFPTIIVELQLQSRGNF